MESIVTMKGNLQISQPPIALIYQLLHGRWGGQHWWPAETSWEVMIGAVLTQNTSWTNVERAIAGMKGERILDCSTLAMMEESRLAKYLHPCGYVNVKARRLKALAVFMRDKHGGDPVGKEHCRGRPICEGCPLNELLPAGEARI